MRASRSPSRIRTELALWAFAAAGCAPLLGIEDPEVRGWTFDSSAERWSVIVWNGDIGPDVPGLGMDFEREEGNPDPGTLVLDVPFDGVLSQASFGIDFGSDPEDWLDLRNSALEAQVEIQAEGRNAYSAYVLFYAQSGGGCDAEPDEVTETVSYETDAWFSIAAHGSNFVPSGDCVEFEADRVSQLGIRIGSEEPIPAQVFLDSVRY